MTPPRVALLFDLDGTLVDNVYQHVLAWREAFEQVGIELAVWRIHRQIGMSGGLFVSALVRETGQQISAQEAERIQRLHKEAYSRLVQQVRPLPGADRKSTRLNSSHVEISYAVFCLKKKKKKKKNRQKKKKKKKKKKTK